MGVSIINSYRKKEHFYKKGDILGGFIKYLNATSDFDLFMPLDCDEFVAVDTDGPDVKCNIGSIVSELDKFKDTKSPLAIRGSYFNIPNASGQFFFSPERKLIFR